MQQLDLTQWSTRMWFWRGKKHWTLDMDSKGEKNKSIYTQNDCGAKRNKQSRKDVFEIPFVYNIFFTLLKLAICAAEGLFRKHKHSFRAVSRLHHRDTGIAVLHINNTTNSWGNFRGQWRPDSVSSAHVKARYATIWGHKYVNWVVNQEGKILRIRTWYKAGIPKLITSKLQAVISVTSLWLWTSNPEVVQGWSSSPGIPLDPCHRAATYN